MKIVLTGDGSVGKTALRQRYLGRGFKSQYMMTIGADFAIKDTEITSGKYAGQQIKCQIWDLAGQVGFKNVRALYYTGSHGALLVYDCTRINSFESVHSWMNEIQKNAGHKIPVVLIANKIDLRNHVDHALSTIDGEDIARKITKEYYDNKISIPYLETSAKTGENVNLAFLKIVELIVQLF